MEKIDKVAIYPNFPEHKVQIGTRLNDTLKERLLFFLSQNHDYFATWHEDMIGIDLEVSLHRLQVDPDYQPVK